MLEYITRRLLLAFFIVWVISVLSFVILELPPGDAITRVRGYSAQHFDEAELRAKEAEIRAGSSQMGQDMAAAHFGVGRAETVDSLTITWPGGKIQTLTDVPLNQRITVTEPE